jgi:cell wall-active antibiotic response 4TMS protein YvqF
MEDYQPNRSCRCTRCRCRGIMGPAILVTLGVLFLLDNLDIRGASFDHTWPLILIVIGIVMVMRGNASTAGHISPPPPSMPMTPSVAVPPPSPHSSGEVNNV